MPNKPTPAQRRFVCDRDTYARLMETRVPAGNIGIAPHSLRAVTLDDLQWLALGWPNLPAHIHVAELRFHDTRHTTGTLLAQKGVAVKAIQDFLERTGVE